MRLLTFHALDIEKPVHPLPLLHLADRLFDLFGVRHDPHAFWPQDSLVDGHSSTDRRRIEAGVQDVK